MFPTLAYYPESSFFQSLNRIQMIDARNFRHG
jgi:hypothetical protein